MSESKKNTLGLWLGTIAVGAGLIGTSLYLYAKNGKVKVKKTKGGKGKSKKGKGKSKKSTRKPKEDLQAQKNAMQLPQDDEELKAELDAIKQVARVSDNTTVGVALNHLFNKAANMDPKLFSNENRAQVAQMLMLHHDLLNTQMSQLPKNFGDMYKNKLKEKAKALLMTASAWLEFEDMENDELRMRIAFKLEDYEAAAAVFDRLLAGPREPGTEKEYFLASMAPFLGKFTAFKELCQRNPDFLRASRMLGQSGQPDYQSFYDLTQPFNEDIPLSDLKFNDFLVLSRQLLFKKMVDSDPERVESVSKTINAKTKDFIDLGPNYRTMVVKGALVITSFDPVHMPQSLPLVGCLVGDSLKLQCVLRAPSNPISIEEVYDLKLVEKQAHDVLLYSGTYDFKLASCQEDGTYKDTTSFHYDCSFKVRSSRSTFANQPGPDFGKPVTLPVEKAQEEKAKIELEDENEAEGAAELPSPTEEPSETSEEAQETEQKAPAVESESETLETVIVSSEVVAESESESVEAVVEAVVAEAVEEVVEVAEAVAEIEAAVEAVEEAVEAAAVEAVVEEVMQAQAEEVIEAVAEAEAEAANVVESVHSEAQE